MSNGNHMVPTSKGFGINSSAILTIMSPDSAASRRLIADARQAGKLVDMCAGKRAKSLILLNTGHVVTVAVHGITMRRRFAATKE